MKHRRSCQLIHRYFGKRRYLLSQSLILTPDVILVPYRYREKVAVFPTPAFLLISGRYMQGNLALFDLALGIFYPLAEIELSLLILDMTCPGPGRAAPIGLLLKVYLREPVGDASYVLDLKRVVCHPIVVLNVMLFVLHI
jgi:hypothetical protein